ncbi:MAG: hypothetical protein J6S53_05460 [Lentisphaeria bacterium]|nr:hypothetical protein [Lentisphaeria bacterium]
MKEKENWNTLLQKYSSHIQYGKEALDKIPFYLEKCFKDWEKREKIQEYISLLHSSPELLAFYSKILLVLEEGILNGFTGKINDSLLEEPFPFPRNATMPEAAFLLLLALSCIPAGEKAFLRKDLPPEKLYEALDEFDAWSNNCFRNYAISGLQYSHGFAWLIFRILPGIVLRFGRLEYNHSLFFPDILVFRNRKTGEYIPLVNGKYDVNRDGKLAIHPKEETAFSTILPAGIFGSYTGNTVNADGKIRQEKTSFDLQEYELILRPGDEVLYMHIPELGPLTPEEVEESFIKVREFYSRKESSYHPRGIICASWLFDPVLQDLLPENANLVRFQKSGFLLPPKGTSCDVIYRVFGVKGEKEGIDKVEWKSSLQKVLGNYLQNGGFFRGGRYFRMF